MTTILSAGKITGKTASGLGIGILSAVTTGEEARLRDGSGAVVGDAPVEPWTHYLVGRVEQDLDRSNHTLGALVTAVNRGSREGFEHLPSGSYMFGVDGVHKWQNNAYSLEWQIAASHVRGSETAITRLQRAPFRYFQRPDASHLTLDESRTDLSGYALAAGINKRGGAWRYWGQFRRVSPGFDINDVGFQRSGDAQSLALGAGYMRARPVGPLRSLWLGIGLTQDWTSAWGRTSTWFRPVIVNAALRNNWQLTINPVALMWGRMDVGGTRGGPALRENNWHNSFAYISSDRRKPLSVELGGGFGGDFGTSGRWWDVSPSVLIRPNDVVNVNVGVRYAWGRDPKQWVGRVTAADSLHYLVAEIDNRTLSVTGRIDWTLSPTLSVQLYAQPFVSAGRYTDFKDVSDPRAERFEDRFSRLGATSGCSDGTCELDMNRDGSPETTVPDPDFNFRALRSTTVLRWEYRPGSVLYVGWQHGRSDYLQDSSFGAFDDLADLRHLPTDNTLLVKFSYWLGF